MKEMNSTCVDVDFGACWICMFLIKSTRKKKDKQHKNTDSLVFCQIFDYNISRKSTPSACYTDIVFNIWMVTHQESKMECDSLIECSKVLWEVMAIFCKIVVKCKGFKLIQGFPIVFDLRVHVYSKYMYVEIYVQWRVISWVHPSKRAHYWYN